MKAVSEDDAELVSAAKQTLADLPGENVDAQIVAMLPGAEGSAHYRSCGGFHSGGCST